MSLERQAQDEALCSPRANRPPTAVLLLVSLVCCSCSKQEDVLHPVIRRPDEAVTMEPLVFIVGCARSGTTLLQWIVNAHNEVSAPSPLPCPPAAGGEGAER